MTVRVVFMGTPRFAVPSLEALLAGAFQVVGVFTPPDRAAGRGQQVVLTPVKAVAIARRTPVFQPEKLSAPGVFDQLAALKPDIIVLAAYGHLLKADVLNLPPHGAVNIHPSLLPRHRGASPVAGAILSGDEVTGVSIMLMDSGMDTGPILARREWPVRPEDTTGTLMDKLATAGAHLLAETLPSWLDGKITPQPQDNSRATFTKVFGPQDGLMDWKLPARDLWLRVRAYNPWPGSFTFWKGKRLKVVEAVPVDGESVAPGQVVALAPSAPAAVGVGTGRGVLSLVRLQLEGKRELPVAEFLRGSREFVGSVLGGGGGSRPSLTP